MRKKKIAFMMELILMAAFLLLMPVHAAAETDSTGDWEYEAYKYNGNSGIVLSGTANKIIVHIPKSKLKSYKKFLRKKGISSSADYKSHS